MRLVSLAYFFAFAIFVPLASHMIIYGLYVLRLYQFESSAGEERAKAAADDRLHGAGAGRVRRKSTQFQTVAGAAIRGSIQTNVLSVGGVVRSVGGVVSDVGGVVSGVVGGGTKPTARLRRNSSLRRESKRSIRQMSAVLPSVPSNEDVTNGAAPAEYLIASSRRSSAASHPPVD